MSTDISEQDGAWRVTLNHMEQEFYAKRKIFHDDISRYCRQNAYSNYVSELDLSNKLRELSELRNNLISFSKDHLPDTSKYPYKVPSSHVWTSDNKLLSVTG